MSGQRQWKRFFQLVVAEDGSNTTAIDLSDFHVKFHITQAITSRPCTAEITVYNPSDETVNAISAPINQYVKDAHMKVIIDAGYEERHSVIFQGDLWWKSTGRESETDTYLRLIAASGDTANQYAVVNRSLPAGASQSEAFDVVMDSMKDYGVGVCKRPTLSEAVLPRGKALYGLARDIMQGIADRNGFDWSYDPRGIVTIPKQGALPPAETKRVVVLTPNTGLLGRPNITENGIKARMLLNPLIDFGGLVQIDQSLVQNPDYQTAYSAVNENLPATGAMVAGDGLYLVKSREHIGDTRGDEWYTDIIAIGYSKGVQIPVSTEVYNFIPNTGAK